MSWRPAASAFLAIFAMPPASAHPPGPTASFSGDPASPRTGDSVTFTSTAEAGAEHWIAVREWDLDNDGQFDDGFGETAQRSFAGPGRYTVTLRVVDLHGQEAVASDVVVIDNQPPTASFTHRPEAPLAGETITLFSTSTDPDSPIKSQSWDLDGDGSFNDASGPVASLNLPLEGVYSVGLQVVDGDGSAAVAHHTLLVGARASVHLSARFLSPFPVVRMAGAITRTGILIRRFTVSAPVGTAVAIRCRGRGCPFRSQRRMVVREREASRVALLRVRRLERRRLRAGVVIRVFLTKPGAVGKFTEFKIRKRRVPARTDRCLVPGSARPVPCPTV